MSVNKSVNNHAAVAAKPPVTVWILTVLMGVMAFVAVVGSFLFAFPMGGLLGYIVGTLLIVFGIGYATLAWRLDAANAWYGLPHLFYQSCTRSL